MSLPNDPSVSSGGRSGFDQPHAFLGALPSELVTDQDLHPTYRAVAAAVEEVRTAWLEGRVNERQAAVRLAQLRTRDVRGTEWTVGVESKRWYRRLADGRWSSSPAPSLEPGSAEPRPWYLSAALADGGDVTEVGETQFASVAEDNAEVSAPEFLEEKSTDGDSGEVITPNTTEDDGFISLAELGELPAGKKDATLGAEVEMDFLLAHFAAAEPTEAPRESGSDEPPAEVK